PRVLTIASAPPARYLYAGAIALLIAAGCLVRSWGVVPVPLEFWADEAWWATLLATGEFSQFGFRPPGYMWLCRALLGIGSPELMLRLPSLLAGCAALVCLYFCAELSTRTRATVLFVLLVAAFHPKLVVFAKEFKPYSVEVFVFAALTLWTLRTQRAGSVRSRAGLVAAAVVALPFCYPVVFLYPGIALALFGPKLALLGRLSARQWVYGSLLVLTALVLVHLLTYEMLGAGASRLLWGAKYDVFPIGTDLPGAVAWYAQKTWELIALAGELERMPLAGTALFGAAYATGLAQLVRGKRWNELALFTGPLVMALAANLLGYWPYGAFRANLFLVPGAILIAAQAVDWAASRRWGRHAAYGALALLLLAATAGGLEPYRSKHSVHWTAAPQLTAVVADIARRSRNEGSAWTDVILADWHSWRPLLYYLPRAPELQQRARLVAGPVADLAALEARLAGEIDRAVAARRPTRLWLVITRLDAHAAIRRGAAVARYAVYQREFATGDRDYHPLLIELRVAVPADLLPAAARRYDPRPRAIRAS
ncbi:MAG: hypothetical protein ACT4UQ_06240, partial [Gammaproteobacteria bacterium]